MELLKLTEGGATGTVISIETDEQMQKSISFKIVNSWVCNSEPTASFTMSCWQAKEVATVLNKWILNKDQA